MPRFRLLAVDLDGTLLDSSFKVPEVNRRAISRLEEAGVVTVIVTGRRFPAVLEVMNGVDVDPWLVLNGGALVKEGRAGSVVERALLPLRTALDVLAVAREIGACAVVHDGPDGEGELIIERGAPAHPKLEMYLDDTSPRRVSRLEEGLGRDPVEIMFAASLAEIAAVESALAARLPGQVNLARTAYPRRDFAILDVVAPDCSKGAALEIVARRFGVALPETIAMGDNWNDVEMLERAGFAVVMGNAAPEIRALGFAVTATNDEGGFALAVDRYVL